MNHPTENSGRLASALAYAALGAVVFLSLAGGWHFHGDEAGEVCHVCIQIDQGGFHAPTVFILPVPSVLVRCPVPANLFDKGRILVCGGPARAPPVLS